MIIKKKSVFISIIVITLITIAFAYYMTPLTADKIFKPVDNGKVVKIYFGFYKNGIMNQYEVEFDKQEEINQIINTFNDSNYTRIPMYRNIRNDGKLLSMILFEEDSTSHILDINNQGYLTIDRKTYTLTRHQTKIFNELYEILVANHKPVPANQ